VKKKLLNEVRLVFQLFVDSHRLIFFKQKGKWTQTLVSEKTTV